MKGGWKLELIRSALRPLGLLVAKDGHSFEVIEAEHLRRFFRGFAVDCVFDVGANVGQYGSMLREEVNYTGPIYSFEPNPEVARQLRERTKNDASWRVIETVLDDSERDVTFNVMKESVFSSLHIPQTSETREWAEANTIAKSLPLRATTLASAMAEVQKVVPFKRPFLKTDTQGHDWQVIAGGGQRIKEFTGIQSEMAFSRAYEDALPYDELIRRVQGLGFRLSSIFMNTLTSHFPELIESDCIMYNPAFTPVRA